MLLRASYMEIACRCRLGRCNYLNRHRRTKRPSVTEGNGIPKMKKLLWVNGRKSTGLERQHGVCAPEEINECATHQTDAKDKKMKLVLTFMKCALCPLWCVCVCVVCVVFVVWRLIHTQDCM